MATAGDGIGVSFALQRYVGAIGEGLGVARSLSLSLSSELEGEENRSKR
jgi:hypothetical protein